jgi:hypothetical protein
MTTALEEPLDAQVEDVAHVPIEQSPPAPAAAPAPQPLALVSIGMAAQHLQQSVQAIEAAIAALGLVQHRLNFVVHLEESDLERIRLHLADLQAAERADRDKRSQAATAARLAAMKNQKSNGKAKMPARFIERAQKAKDIGRSNSPQIIDRWGVWVPNPDYVPEG